jgi:hypothetical protein
VGVLCHAPLPLRTTAASYSPQPAVVHKYRLGVLSAGGGGRRGSLSPRRPRKASVQRAKRGRNRGRRRPRRVLQSKGSRQDASMSPSQITTSDQARPWRGSRARCKIGLPAGKCPWQACWLAAGLAEPLAAASTAACIAPLMALHLPLGAAVRRDRGQQRQSEGWRCTGCQWARGSAWRIEREGARVPWQQGAP